MSLQRKIDSIRQFTWARSEVGLSRLPVTEEIAGSNPVGPAKIAIIYSLCYYIYRQSRRHVRGSRDDRQATVGGSAGMVPADLPLWCRPTLGQALVHVGWWILPSVISASCVLVAHQAVPAQAGGEGRVPALKLPPRRFAEVAH